MRNSQQTSCLVLVAEDDALIGMNLEEELEGVAYEIAGPFSTCAEAIHWLKTATPDVAVLDIHLRDGTCVELARELTARGVPFAVFSGEDQAHTLPEFKSAAWISKPALRAELLDAVARLVPERTRCHG
jgi:DNA-binding response OmpR family regulator